MYSVEKKHQRNIISIFLILFYQQPNSVLAKENSLFLNNQTKFKQMKKVQNNTKKDSTSIAMVEEVRWTAVARERGAQQR